MATADSVKAKIMGLIDAANRTTGRNDTDLTSAVNALIKGYGQSGSKAQAILGEAIIGTMELGNEG